VFDEVDVGVGGRSGRVIGEKLWQLARHHQLLCITHLPQVAVFGDQHQKIRKVVQGGRTSTAVDALDGGELVEELAQMVGGATAGVIARRAAQDLLEAGAAVESRGRRCMIRSGTCPVNGRRGA